MNRVARFWISTIVLALVAAPSLAKNPITHEDVWLMHRLGSPVLSPDGKWVVREINNGGPPWGGSAIWREQSPSTYAGDFKTPMMLTIGEKDYRVPLNQTLAAWSYLKRNRVPSRLIVFHDANHWIMRGHDAKYFWDEVHAWLEKYLAP
jgi:pimeloyl-ACP methyl ester carboxylesterase